MAAADTCAVVRREKTDVDRIWVWEWENGEVKYVALVNGHRKVCSSKVDALQAVEEYQAACEARRAQQQAKAALDPAKHHHKKQKKKSKAAEASAVDPSDSSTAHAASLQVHSTTQLQRDRANALRQENEALAAKVAELKARRVAAESFCSAAATACALPSRPRPARQMQQRNGTQMPAAQWRGRPSRKPRDSADAAATKETDQPSSKQRRSRGKQQQDATAQQLAEDISPVSNDAAQIVADALAVAKKTPKKQGPGRKAVKIDSAAVVGQKAFDATYAAEQALKALAGLAVC